MVRFRRRESGSETESILKSTSPVPTTNHLDRELNLETQIPLVSFDAKHSATTGDAYDD